MRLPLTVRMAAALAGVQAKDFGIGWARGVLVWKLRAIGASDVEPGARAVFPAGSVKRAAFDAAVAFMRESGQ